MGRLTKEDRDALNLLFAAQIERIKRRINECCDRPRTAEKLKVDEFIRAALAKKKEQNNTN